MKNRGIALVLSGVLLSTMLVALASSAHAALNRISIAATPTVTTIDKGTITLTPPVSNSPGAWSVLITDTRIATANGLTVTLLEVGSTSIRYFQEISGEFNSVSDSSRLTVNPGLPTLSNFPDRAVNLSQNFFTLTPPTSSSDALWSYESLNTNIATVTGNTVTLRDGGAVQIRATQAPARRWLSSSITMTLTVNAPTPTLGSFSDINLSIDSVARVQLTMPRSNSTGAWTLSSSDPTIVSLDGFNLLTLKSGSAIITARQAPAGGFQSTSTSMKVTVAGVTPNVAVGGFQDFDANLNSGETKVIPFISPTSTSPAPWSFTSSDPTIAVVNGLNLIALKPGIITITANQPALGNFAAVGPIAIKVTIRGNLQLAKLPNFSKLVGDPAVKIQYPTSLSSGIWSATSSMPSVAAVSGENITFEGPGTATITLTQSATESYTASSTSFDVTVIASPPTLGAFAALSIGVGEKITTPFTPQSPSTGKWIITSSDPSIASITDGVITGVKVGIAIISAFQEPAGRFGQSQTVQTTITIKPAPTIATPTNITLVINAQQILTSPTSNSGGTWSYTSSNPAIAFISGATLSALTTGTAVITATQAATDSYTFGSTTFAVTVITAVPTLGAFESLTVTAGEKITTPFTPQSTSTGRWIITSSDPSIATIVDGVITGIKAGIATITAFQEAAGRFGQSGTVQTTITVKQVPVITTPANITLVINAQQAVTSPISNSGGTFSYTSSNPAIAFISGSTLSGLTIGSTTITAIQSAYESYTAGFTYFDVTVIGAVPTLGAFESLTVNVGEQIIFTPQSPSTGRWIIASSDPSIASIADGVINGIKGGSATITAFQEAAGRYAKSETVQITITVKPAPTITTPANISLVAGTQRAIAIPTSNSGGTWSYTSSNPAIATIAGSTISALTVGTATITATQAATTAFTGASTTFSITVAPVPAPPAPRATAIPTKRVINVTLTNATGKQVIVKINGVISRVGKNTVKPGKKLVTVQVDGKLILNKVIIIR